MKKRFLAMTLVLGLLLPVGAGAAPALADATPKQWATRGDLIALLAQASGVEVTQYADSEVPFTDVDDRDATVRWAYAKWLVNGDENGLFRPHDPITRQEAAAVLGRYLDYCYTALPPGCGTGAPRMDNIAAWAQNGVMQCWMYGVIDTGDQPDFHPNDAVSGLDAQSWVVRANGLTVGAVGAPETRTFADALVAAAQAEGNFTLSPYSARLCLAMLANGAKGETQKELLAALQIDDLSAFNESVKAQLKTYDGYARIMSLDTANSIWLNQSWFDGKGVFLPAFQKTMQDAFRAETREVTRENSVEQVNRWVNDKTKGKVPTILTEDNREFVTALVNAVYFKAAWKNEFYENRTQKADFTNADGTKTKVDMMRQTDHFGYYATPGIEALKMDYRKDAVDNEDGDNYEYFRDADLSMYLIRADGDVNVQHLLDNAAFDETLVRVSVPRFKIEYGQALNAALQSMGVKTAYDAEKADLSAMVDPSGLPGGMLYLDTVLQKTFIAVDEKGTEAAAVTAAIANAGGALLTRPALVREFTADAPFWFAIRDNASGEILFVGRYETAK